MTIDWSHFSPWSSLSGGILLGIAAALFILINGRILGISGIVGGLLPPKRGDAAWRLFFLLGMATSPWVFKLVAPVGFMAQPRFEVSAGLVALAGFLVGLGTRYGSGCTSGHGVCGLSRMSPRSVVATLTFMATGFFTVYIMRHII